jgi:diguanylate cyclase (GGDEF)-like protein/PAS domain S-box-containing protein
MSQKSERQNRKLGLDLHDLIFQQSSEAIMITDSKLNIVDVNEAFTTVTRYQREDVLGKNPHILTSGKHDKAFYEKLWTALKSKGHWEGEIWNRKKTGEVYPEWLSITAVMQAGSDEADYYCAIFSDITRRKRAEEKLEAYAYQDPLTGLPNRRTCLIQLDTVMKTAKRDKTLAAVLFIDLDRFKPINDEYGHHVGDELLKVVSERLQATIREEDIVARIGGDEFLVILKRLRQKEDSVNLAKKLIASITKPIEVEDVTCKIGMSVGIASYPLHAKTARDLLELADSAMYLSKTKGGNSITLAKEPH